MLAGIGEPVGTGDDERVVGIVDDSFEPGHEIGIDDSSNVIAYEKEFRLRMVDNVMNLLGIELMEDGHSHGAVCEGGEESHSPLAGIAPAKGDLVALSYSGIFKQDMEVFNLACYIMEL